MLISIPLSLALLPYGVILLLFVLLAAWSVHNLVKFGATTNASFVATFAFLAGATFVLFFTWQGLKGTDWQQEITLGSPLNAEFMTAPKGL